MSAVTIKLVNATDTWALRHQVLRPDQPLASVDYKEDSTREALHFAASLKDQIVAVASIYREDESGRTEGKVWRLRGMATAPEIRGTGVGGALLSALLLRLKSQSEERVWCNARITASGFYLHYGFDVVGDEFQMPGIGPHYLMNKVL